MTGQWYHADQAGDAQKNINDPYSDPRKVYQDYPSHFKLDTQLYHLNLQWDLPWFSLKSVSAYQQLYHVQQEDSSRSAFSLLGQYDDVAAWNTNVRNVTEEFDILSPSGQALEWVGGIFLLNQASSQFVVEYGGNTAPTPAQLLIPANVQTSPPGNLNYGNYSYVVRHSASAFAQATWHVTSDFRITGGVRANLDSFSDTSHNFSAFSINTVAHANKDNVTTWRAEADYDVMPDHMVYGSVAKGYKPGGVNGSYGQIVIPALFAPETNTAYEIGSKNYFFDKSLRLNVAAFYYDHKNFQYIETDPFPFDGGIANIPSVHDYGVEFEANYVSPDRRLRVNADLALEKGKVNGSYKAIDSTVANAIIGAGGPCAFGGAYYNPGCWNAIIAAAKNINGATPPAMPEASGSINVSYKFDIPTGAFTPRLEVIYRGSEWARIFNEPSLDKVPAYTVTNLNFEYQPANSALKLSLAATNLFNVAGLEAGGDGHAGFIGDLVEQLDHLDLPLGQPRGFRIVLGGEDVGRPGVHGEDPVDEADHRRGVGVGRRLRVLFQPVPMKRLVQDGGEVRPATHDLVVNLSARDQQRGAAGLAGPKAHQRHHIRTVGVEHQLIPHLGRQGGRVVHGLVGGGVDMVKQVAHFVLAHGLAHVQAENEEDRPRQRVGIEVGPQAPHQNKTPA